MPNAESAAGSSFGASAGLSGGLDHLADLGIQTNGNDSTMSLKDPADLDSALAGNLSGLQTLFSDATKGLAVTLDNYIKKTIGDDGTLPAHQANLTKQSTDIDAQIERMEKTIAAQSDRLTRQFIAMETAQANLAQQLQFLSSRFGTS